MIVATDPRYPAHVRRIPSLSDRLADLEQRVAALEDLAQQPDPLADRLVSAKNLDTEIRDGD